jgi:hypothetical protein
MIGDRGRPSGAVYGLESCALTALASHIHRTRIPRRSGNKTSCPRTRSRPDLRLTVHPHISFFPNAHFTIRHGMLSPAHRPPFGAPGHEHDWPANPGGADQARDAVRTGARAAAAEVQVRQSIIAKSVAKFIYVVLCCWVFRAFFSPKVRDADHHFPPKRVTQNGCVLLGVDSPDSLRMAVALSQMLPGADAYYATQRPEQQHLTLGRFGGTDAAGFAAWLSESLLGQNALLPTFTGSHVQLSDEARPFSNVPVALTGGAGAGATGHGGGFGNGGLGNGNGLRQGGVPLGGFAPVGGGAEFDTPIGGAVGAERPELPRGAGGGLVEARKPAAPVPSGNSLSNNSRPRPSPAAIGIAGGVATPAQAQPASYASAMKVPVSLAAPIGGSYAAAGGVSGPVAATGPGPSRETTTAAAQSSEALLEMLQTSCVGAEGVGVICNSASVSGGFVLRPQEQAAWTLRLAPLVQNLRDVLSSVGALRFCQMIDGVANPHDWSLAIECQPNLARGATLEMVQDQTICAQIEANAVAASNTGAQVRLVAVAVDQKKIGAPGHNDTGSPVMLCRSEHVVDNGTGLTRVASFALHLEPVSGLNSADPPYLSLTFAWLGARWPLASVGDGAEARVANPVPPPMTSGATGNNANPGPRRPGDWTCVGCAAHNFASRSVCFKCKNGKPIGVPSGGSRRDGEFGGKPVSFPGSEPSPGAGAQPVGGSFRPGDWICAGCRAHNFASRGNCFKCKQRKAGAVSEPSAGTEPPAPQAGGGGSLQTASDNFRSGDWLCQNCRAHNFASRGSCFKCSSKPSSS